MSGGSAFRNRWVVPRMSDVAPHLLRAYALGRRARHPVFQPWLRRPRVLCPRLRAAERRVPPALGRHPKTLAEIRNNESEKVKVAACAECLHEPFCLGLWRGYIAIHGDAEVTPVRAGAPSPALPAAPVAQLAYPPSTSDANAVAGNEVLRLTLACNERCPFCNVPTEGDPDFAPPTTEEAKEFIRAFAARVGRLGHELSFSAASRCSATTSRSSS
jgi:hypothetical protein